MSRIVSGFVYSWRFRQFYHHTISKQMQLDQPTDRAIHSIVNSGPTATKCLHFFFNLLHSVRNKLIEAFSNVISEITILITWCHQQNGGHLSRPQCVNIKYQCHWVHALGWASIDIDLTLPTSSTCDYFALIISLQAKNFYVKLYFTNNDIYIYIYIYVYKG